MAALKRTTWLVVAALAVIVLVFVLVHHRQEPEAMGKPLSYWAVRREIGDQTAVRALREIGSNASPELRRMLRTEDWPGERKLVARLQSHRWTQSFVNAGRSAESTHCQALSVIGAIGPPMRPLLPDIVPLATNSSPFVAARALYAIGSIGVYARTNDPVVPVITNSLRRANASIQYAALYALKSLHPSPPEVEPLLIESLKSSDESMRESACEALVGRTNQSVLPYLAARLNSTNPYAITLALEQLGTFHRGGRGSLPRVRELRANSWLPVREAATNALIAIGGEPAPVKPTNAAADITFSFPSIPIAQAIDFYENISGTRIAPPPNGWPPSTTLSIKTHDSVTKSEAEQLIEKCLKQQAKIEIKTRADGTLVAVPIK